MRDPEGAEPRTCGAQFFESEVAVDENPVQADVHQVAENHHDHFDPGVSDAFEELLEGEEEHDERHAVSQQLVIRYGHIDHFDGLSHVVHQRDDGQLEPADQKSQQSIEHQAVLQVLRRFATVALGVEFADQGVRPSAMPTPAMKRMKKTEPPNEVAASGVGSSPP